MSKPTVAPNLYVILTRGMPARFTTSEDDARHAEFCWFGTRVFRATGLSEITFKEEECSDAG